MYVYTRNHHQTTRIVPRGTALVTRSYLTYTFSHKHTQTHTHTHTYTNTQTHAGTAVDGGNALNGAAVKQQTMLLGSHSGVECDEQVNIIILIYTKI